MKEAKSRPKSAAASNQANQFTERERTVKEGEEERVSEGRREKGKEERLLSSRRQMKSRCGRARERERERETHTHLQRQSHCNFSVCICVGTSACQVTRAKSSQVNSSGTSWAIS